MRLRAALALACAAVLLWPGPAPAEDKAQANVYLWGSTLRTGAEVRGDLVALGGQVTLDQPVAKDALLAGGELELLAAVGEDLRAAAGQLRLGAPVAGDAMLAGGSVRLAPGSRIGGRAWVVGGDVQLLGQVDGALTLRAGRALIDGIVAGDIDAEVGSLSLGPRADLRGQLRYRSGAPAQIDPAAKAPRVRYEEAVPAQARRGRGFGEDAAWARHDDERTANWLGGVGRWLGLLAAGALLLLLVPRVSATWTGRLGDAPWASLGIGTLLALLSPPVALLLVITLLGIPLALLGLMAAAVLSVLGYLVAAIWIGEQLAQQLRRPKAPVERAGERLAWFALALLTLALLGQLPLLGRLLQLLALLAGAGAIFWVLWRRLRGKPGNQAGSQARSQSGSSTGQRDSAAAQAPAAPDAAQPAST